MDYLITNLIDELLWQLESIDAWYVWNVLIFAYFGTAIAQHAGKYAALRENDKALNPIANAFYEGAMYGLAKAWVDVHPMNEYLIDSIIYSLIQTKVTKRPTWA